MNVSDFLRANAIGDNRFDRFNTFDATRFDYTLKVQMPNGEVFDYRNPKEDKDGTLTDKGYNIPDSATLLNAGTAFWDWTAKKQHTVGIDIDTDDNDGIYGQAFQRRMKQLGIEEVPITPHSPWQNPYVERLIGTIRRECLNHVIVLDERHSKRILTDYLDYYHSSRTHQSLDGNAPWPREVEPPERGPVVAQPMVGGLHHRYFRRVA